MKVALLVVVVVALLYAVRVPLRAVLFPEEVAMYAERVRIGEALANF